MMLRTAAIALLAVGCWRGPAQQTTITTRSPSPTSSPTKPEASYRNVTMAVDAISVGLIAGGMIVYQTRGLESIPGHVLVGAGGLAALGTPIIHATRGHVSRGGASYVIRAGMTTVGMLTAIGVTCANEPGFLCELTPNMWWGIAGGVAVSGALDALLLHDASSTWSPTVTPTDDGARVGIAKIF